MDLSVPGRQLLKTKFPGEKLKPSTIYAKRALHLKGSEFVKEFLVENEDTHVVIVRLGTVPVVCVYHPKREEENKLWNQRAMAYRAQLAAQEEAMKRKHRRSKKFDKLRRKNRDRTKYFG